jgi:hypothetical protein
MSVNSAKQNIEQVQDWIKVNNIKPAKKPSIRTNEDVINDNEELISKLIKN